jgi:hypothetical protein
MCNHTYNTDKWITNDTHHWHESTCGHDAKGDYTEHSDIDGNFKCDGCGAFYEDLNPDEPEYEGPAIETPPHYIGGGNKN